MKIGVLALQGDYTEHQVVLQSLGVEVVQVRLAQHLIGLNGLIIPGGESTTIGKLAMDFDLMDPPIWSGTRYMGHLCRCYFPFHRYPPQPTLAEIDGHRGSP
jgi:glutamine amidotransferase PdxT